MNGDSVVIVGNGAGGCATAALLAERGLTVTLAGRSATKTEMLRDAGALTLVESGSRRDVTGIVFAETIAEAVTGQQLVIVMVPTSAVIEYATMIAPALSASATVLLAPGHTGGALAFRRAMIDRRPDLASVPVAETFTLPVVARLTGPAEVTVWRVFDNLLTGVLPAGATHAVMERFSRAFPQMVPASSVLESSLSNLNAVMHPAGTIMNAGWIEHSSGGFRFYSDGVTPAVARVMDGIDSERLRIAQAFGLSIPGFLQAFEGLGLVSHADAASGSTYIAVSRSGPNKEIKAPATLRDRYVEEDVGMGLVAMSAFARTVGVATPVSDSLITLAGLINDVDYFSEGLTAERLGIAGLNHQEIVDLVM